MASIEEPNTESSIRESSTERSNSEKFIKGSYSSLAIALVVVLFNLVLYFFSYLQCSLCSTDPASKLAYIDSVTQGIIYVGAAILLAVLAVGTIYYSNDQHTLGRTSTTVNPQHRSKLLPVFALLTLVGLGVIVFATGGGEDSPFAHYLIAAATLAIVFARRGRTRKWVMGGSVAAYTISLPALTSGIWGPRIGDLWAAVFELWIVITTVLVVAIADWDYSVSSDSASDRSK